MTAACLEHLVSLVPSVSRVPQARRASLVLRAARDKKDFLEILAQLEPPVSRDQLGQLVNRELVVNQDRLVQPAW